MELYRDQIAKYVVGGSFGALVPTYLISLLISEAKPFEALKIDGTLTVGRLIILALSKLPKLNNLPFLRKSYNLFLPEIYGAIAGVSAIAAFNNFKDYRKAKYLIKEGGLEKTIESQKSTEQNISKTLE